MAKLETAVLEAHPTVFERVAPYRVWTGLPGYDPNMRRALMRHHRCLLLVFVMPDSNTVTGSIPTRWQAAAFGPGYSAPLTPSLHALWDAYAAQRERRVVLEQQRELAARALLVSSDEAHRLVLLLVALEPRDDRRFRQPRADRSVE